MDYLYITENQYQDLLESWENNQESGIENDPLAYIMVIDEGFIAIDNSSGDFFTEEFSTEIEAKLYLGAENNFGKDELIASVQSKVTKEYQTFEDYLLSNYTKQEIINASSEIVTKNEVKYLLTNNDYLNSLSPSMLSSFLDFKNQPLSDVWHQSLKFSEFDLSPEVIDDMLVSLYEEKPSLNDRLDFFINEKNDRIDYPGDKETERWTNY